jgi:hypothetical protein
MGPDPQGSLRWLGDEVEDDTEDRERQAAELAEKLAECEQFMRLFAVPEWPVMEEYLSQEALAAQKALADPALAPSMVHVAAYRGRLHLAMHLIGLPEEVAARQQQLAERLDRIDHKDEEGEEEQT